MKGSALLFGEFGKGRKSSRPKLERQQTNVIHSSGLEGDGTTVDVTASTPTLNKLPRPFSSTNDLTQDFSAYAEDDEGIPDKRRIFLDPVQPGLIVRKVFKVFKGKEKTMDGVNVDLSARLVTKGVESAAITLSHSRKVFDTKLGPVHARLSGYMRRTVPSMKLEGAGVNGALYTDFDPQKIGNFELSNKILGYQIAIPIYVKGPCKGSGVTLRTGAKFSWHEQRMSPWIGVGNIKVKPNVSTALLGGSVLGVLVATHLKLNALVKIPVPKTGKKMKSFVGLNLSKKQGPYGLTVFNIANFEYVF